MSERRFTQSPLRLRATQGPRIQIQIGDETVELDREPAPTETDDEDEDLIRVSDPSPGITAKQAAGDLIRGDDADPPVIVMLHSGPEYVDSREGVGLTSSSVEGISEWIERSPAGDRLTVTLKAPDILDQELRNLAWLADHENLEIEIRLDSDV